MTGQGQLHSPRRLDVETVEQACPAWHSGFPRPLVDLSQLTQFDPFALLLLALHGRRCREAGGHVRFLLPENARALQGLVRAGLFRLLEDACWTDRPVPKVAGSTPPVVLVRVPAESAIRPIVDDTGERLEDRFPFGQRANRLLVGALIELLQNITHHAAPRGGDPDPFGLACLEETRHNIHLAVGDKGIGLAGSLGLNPSFHGLSPHRALEAVLVDGASRFDDLGRGGALKRIREVVRESSGRLYVRSGSGALLQQDVEWSVGEVHPFPGVQISIRLPRLLFEPPPEESPDAATCP